MRIEEALREHEERVDALIKAGTRYMSALKAWKKACQTGHMGNRQKSAAAAEDLAQQLQEPTHETSASWTFDIREYLDTAAWRRELQTVCSAGFGLRTLEEEDTLVVPPIVVRSQPGQNRLLLGKTGWQTLHPRVTGAYLKRLNEKSTSASILQQFLNALYDGSKKVSQQGDNFAKFRDLYDLFAFAPGWAKENSAASFAQQVYSLHRSDVRTTRDGKTFEIEYPTGKPKEKDIFSVISDDGRPIRYYGIWFR